MLTLKGRTFIDLGSTHFGHERWADTTAGKLLVAIIFSQAPQFSLVQSDVIVDLEVIQPGVITFWVDLDRRMCQRVACGKGEDLGEV